MARDLSVVRGEGQERGEVQIIETRGPAQVGVINVPCAGRWEVCWSGSEDGKFAMCFIREADEASEARVRG